LPCPGVAACAAPAQKLDTTKNRSSRIQATVSWPAKAVARRG
jgi:hypothetical protein